MEEIVGDPVSIGWTEWSGGRVVVPAVWCGVVWSPQISPNT